MTELFINMGLKSEFIPALDKLNITEPTEVQKKVIPLFLENKDIIAQSQTGTGKTLSYLLPLLQKLESKREVQVIILAPTHELASQIKTVTETVIKESKLPLTYALIIGEVNIKRQIDKLKDKPNIIIGSSGRILELIEKKKINSLTIKTLIIDEADRLLDIKNLSSVKKIFSLTPKDKQNILISAGINDSSISNIKEFLNNPEYVKTDSTNNIPTNIKHSYYLTDNKNKIDFLRRLINFIKPEKSIVFVQQSEDVEKLTTEVKYHGLKVAGIFGSQSKEDRKKVIDEFRKGKVQILFATDILARGLDIQDVTHIFNYNISKDAQSYLHRAGRTGRQNKEGISVSIVNNEEKKLLMKIAKDLSINIEKLDI